MKILKKLLRKLFEAVYAGELVQILDMRAYAASLFVEILNEITACKNEEELRRCIRLLEKRHKYDKPELSWYFKWGFGHNHFWVSDLNGVRLIFVEF